MKQNTKQTMQRRTKIVATMGPASNGAVIIEELILAGVNVFRLNFSHGNTQTHSELAALVRQVAKKLNCYVAIMGDLQGPKIRIGGFAEGFADIEAGDEFIIDAGADLTTGNSEHVGIDFDLSKDCSIDQHLMLDDGRIELIVTSIDGSVVKTRVLTGGRLLPRKGLNLRGGGLSNDVLTLEDLNNIELAAKLGLDYLAISFPTSDQDIIYAREICQSHGYSPKLIAKIERAELVASQEALNAVVAASDGVMVARGDLGVEIGDEELIGVQKKIISTAIKMNRLVITATQMMESMIENTIPTRAEVMDVANSVLDGTDAVMLSAETATGKHPVKVVEAMSRVILGAEKHCAGLDSRQNITDGFDAIDESIAKASIYTASRMKGVNAIVCFTESGDTTLWMSRVLLNIPIIALSSHQNTLNRVALFRGVNASHWEFVGKNATEVVDNALAHLTKEGILEKSDKVIATFGQRIGSCGFTDTMTVRIIE